VGPIAGIENEKILNNFELFVCVTEWKGGNDGQGMITIGNANTQNRNYAKLTVASK